MEQSSYEEVAYLLLYGRLPETEEFERFCNELSKNREIPDDLIKALKPVARGAHPMDLLRTAVAFLGRLDPEARDLSREALYRKSVRTIAKLPAVIAAGYRLGQGHEPISPMRQLSHAQNFLYMLSGYGPDVDAVTALDKLLILHGEHESEGPGFTVRVAAPLSTEYHSAVTAFIGSLKNMLHGEANEHAMQMLQCIGELDRAEEWVADALAEKQRILGFVPCVHRNVDTRARIMKELSRELGEKLGDMRWHFLGEKIEEIMLRERGLRHNLAFYAGPILNLLGVPAELSATVFAAGRIAGWSAHIIEQFDSNRPIRPQIDYQGPQNLPYQPIEARNGARKISNS